MINGEVIKIIVELRKVGISERLSILSPKIKRFIENYNKIFDVEENSNNDGESLLLNAISLLFAYDGSVDEQETSFLKLILKEINTSKNREIEALQENLAGKQEAVKGTLEAISKLLLLLKRTKQYENLEQDLAYIFIGIVLANGEVNYKEVEVLNKYFDLPCSVSDFTASHVIAPTPVKKSSSPTKSAAKAKEPADQDLSKKSSEKREEEGYLPLIKKVRGMDREKIALLTAKKINSFVSEIPGASNEDTIDTIRYTCFFAMTKVVHMRTNIVSVNDFSFFSLVHIYMQTVNPLNIPMLAITREDQENVETALQIFHKLCKALSSSNEIFPDAPKLFSEFYIIGALLDDNLRSLKPTVINDWIISNLQVNILDDLISLPSGKAPVPKEKKSSKDVFIPKPNPQQNKPVTRLNNESDFLYEIYERNGQKEIRILGLKGSPDYIEIPDLIEGLPVTAIHHRAFYSNHSSLSSVILPSSLISIGNDAFKWCYYIKQIIIPTSVQGIGMNALKDVKRIYCRAPKKPDGWDVIWNGERDKESGIIWGYSK